jgi:hypothetical protein
VNAEILYNIMSGYNKKWNDHRRGMDCWCKPHFGGIVLEKTTYIVHRNYHWDGTKWVAIKEGWDA